MKAEDLLFNDCSQREVVEQVSEVFPDVNVAVFAQAFIVETVDLCYLTRFMISSEYGDSILIADL